MIEVLYKHKAILLMKKKPLQKHGNAKTCQMQKRLSLMKWTYDSRRTTVTLLGKLHKMLSENEDLAYVVP